MRFRLPWAQLGGGTAADDEYLPPAAGLSAAAGRETTADALLHATPQGRAVGR